MKRLEIKNEKKMKKKTLKRKTKKEKLQSKN